MSPLRQRMIEDMKLAGLSAATHTIYINAVRGLAAHYRRSPDEHLFCQTFKASCFGFGGSSTAFTVIASIA